MSLPTQQFAVPVAGGDLAVFQYGDGQGAPVLLIHGVTSSNRAFQLFADSLIARGKAPFAVDFRGRGDSNTLPGPFRSESGLSYRPRTLLPTPSPTAKSTTEYMHLPLSRPNSLTVFSLIAF